MDLLDKHSLDKMKFYGLSKQYKGFRNPQRGGRRIILVVSLCTITGSKSDHRNLGNVCTWQVLIRLLFPAGISWYKPVGKIFSSRGMQSEIEKIRKIKKRWQDIR